MNKATLDRANEINQQIKDLRQQIEEFPRYIIDPREYKKSGHMYVRRLLIRERYKIKIPKGNFSPNLEFELSEEDLQALVDIRKRKVEKLEEELENLH